MRGKGSMGLGIICVAAMAGFFNCGSGPVFSQDHPDLNREKMEAGALLDKYIRAFESRDLALASEVYAHDRDLIVYGSSPSDRRLGWRQTEEYLRDYFISAESIEVALKERDIKVHASGDVAWFAQVLTWKEVEGGKTYTMDGLRISGVLEKRDGVWRIVQLHASGPPPVS
jgi:ketosteroid isomerase-like protein